MTIKQAIGKLHLWLGLASGLVVFVVSLTGAIFTFQDDIRDLTQPWRWVEDHGQAPLPPSRLKAISVANHPGATASWVSYVGRERSAAVFLSDTAGGSFYAYLDPYTGQLLHEQNLRRDFFTIVQYLHMYLLLPPAIGEWIVGPAVLMFVGLLISGLVLWWPKRKTDRKRAFTIKWGGRWRRVNYDLHNVLGFYAAAIAFVIAFTGLMMSYEWVRNATTFVANAGQVDKEEVTAPAVDTTQRAAPTGAVVDLAYARIRQRSPAAEMILIGPADNPAEPVYGLAYARALHYYHRDEYYFHPVTGRLLKAIPHAVKSAGAKFNDINYDLHTGQILGFGGKVAAFLGSLISASLPITGFLVWWGRRQKKAKKGRTTTGGRSVAASSKPFKPVRRTTPFA
jgi:uncharacterized iron-regulated membrane protein